MYIKRFLVLAVALVIANTSVCSFAQNGTVYTKDTPDSSGTVFSPLPAEQETTITAYTRARRVMDLVSEVEGRCTSVKADVGQPIAGDGLFVTVDTTFIDHDIRQNRIQQKRQQSQLDYLNKEVDRYTDLVTKNLSDQSNLDDLINRKVQAEHDLAELRLLESDLLEKRKRFFIRAPKGWLLIKREAEVGEWLSQGSAVGQAGDYSTLLVPVSLSPGEYAQLMKQRNQPFALHFPDLGLEANATVELVSPSFDPDTRKILVELAVKKGLPDMRGGLRAELHLTMPDPSTLLVPRSAVVQRYEEFWLFRENGERVKVFILGSGPDNTYRVRANDIRMTDTFQASPE